MRHLVICHGRDSAGVVAILIEQLKVVKVMLLVVVCLGAVAADVGAAAVEEIARGGGAAADYVRNRVRRRL